MGLDHPSTHGRPTATRPLVALLLLLATIPLASSAALAAEGRRSLLLPPWVARTRGGANQAAGDGESPAAVLRKEEFELVEEADRYKGRWRSILKVLCWGLRARVCVLGGGGGLSVIYRLCIYPRLPYPHLLSSPFHTRKHTPSPSHGSARSGTPMGASSISTSWTRYVR